MSNDTTVEFLYSLKSKPSRWRRFHHVLLQYLGLAPTLTFWNLVVVETHLQLPHHSEKTGWWIFDLKTPTARRSGHLLSRPQSLWFQDGWRQQLDSALFVRQSSVDQLGVLDSVEEATSDGHPRARHHVVLDQPGQRFAILEEDTVGTYSISTDGYIVATWWGRQIFSDF